MQENFLQENFAARIGGNLFGKDTKIYKFEKIKRAKRAAMAENPGVELIDMGVGEPDDMAFPAVVDTLCKEAANWENRIYADNGCGEFKAAAARYMKSLYGVDLDPETEVVHAIGSKSSAPPSALSRRRGARMPDSCRLCSTAVKKPSTMRATAAL